MEILKVENLTKIYGKNMTKVVALDNVSFSVEKGEFVAIVGASGSGKSTLLHLLGGVDRPTSGKVLIDGEDIYKMSDDELAIFRRRQVGLIYQFYNLIPILNVVENITLPCDLDNKTIPEKDLNELIKNLGLEDRKKHLPNELSGGQQQRLCIARALAISPSILLMDEPTSALDPISTSKIEDLIHELKNDYTIVIVTHNMQQAARVSDKTGYFYLGELIEYDNTRKIFTNPEKESTQNYITGRFG